MDIAAALQLNVGTSVYMHQTDPGSGWALFYRMGANGNGNFVNGSIYTY